MLVIRQPQLQLFADQSLEQAAFERAPRFFPGVCDSLGEELRPAIRRALLKARGYGFSSQSDALQYVYVALLLGENFDDDARLPWARGILKEADGARRPFRAMRLYEAALRHLRFQERRDTMSREVEAR